MGKVFSLVRNPFRNFNVESRAHKIISQAKPIPAPKHKKDQLDYDKLMKDYPDVYEDSLKKNKQLDNNLKDIFVTSYDPPVNLKKGLDPSRPLPSDRTTAESYLYGIKEPDKIPMGKTTLRKVLEFISMHQNDPIGYSAKNIAEKYLLPENKVESILKFYRVFEIYIPEQRHTKAKFAGPSLPKVQIVKQLRKELPPGPEPTDKT